MKIGAASLIRAWGRPMTLLRAGVPLVSFMGRKAEVRAHEVQEFILDMSLDQEVFVVLAAFEDFQGIEPIKFDVIRFDAKSGTGAQNQYTIQRAHEAGADEDEIWKFIVKGGQP